MHLTPAAGEFPPLGSIGPALLLSDPAEKSLGDSYLRERIQKVREGSVWFGSFLVVRLRAVEVVNGMSLAASSLSDEACEEACNDVCLVAMVEWVEEAFECGFKRQEASAAD